MFVSEPHTWTSTKAHHAAGMFLVLFTKDFLKGNREVKALVRGAKMVQSGHFMVGQLTFKFRGGSFIVRLSGAYGADGLTKDIEEVRIVTSTFTESQVSGSGKIRTKKRIRSEPAPQVIVDDLWNTLTSVPEEITQLMWKGTGGHNSPGEEGQAMREWARSNINKLRELPAGMRSR